MTFIHSLLTARKVFIALTLGMAMALLNGCGGIIIGAGATAGVAAYSERGIEQAGRDLKHATQIRANFLTGNSNIAVNVGIEVYEGRALLTGLVDTEEMRADAVKMAWAVTGLKDVINEIQLKSEQGVVEFVHDTWITTQLQAQMTFDEDILAINYVIETVNGTIYLIGIAISQDELDRVIAKARNIERVRKVTSHVRVMEGTETP